MRSARKALAALVAGIAGLVLAVVAPAFACEPGPTLRANPAEAPAGSMVQLRGDGFIASIGSHTVSPVEVCWHESEGDLTGKPLTDVAGPSFTVTVQVPASAQGLTFLSATQWSLSDNTILVRKVTNFQVTSGGAALPGYRLVASDGGVFAFGGSAFLGSMGGRPLDRPIVGMAPTPSGKGYWLVGADGGIFAYGDAGFYGSTGGLRLDGPVVGMAPTASGRGYWLVGADGGIFAFGDAAFLGSASNRALGSIVGMAAHADVYHLATSNGLVYHRPSAPVDVFPIAQPVAAIAGAAVGGYWLVENDGTVFATGAGHFGSITTPLHSPVVGLARTASSQGYWLAAADGGVFAFGDAPFLGSLGGIRLDKPIVGASSV